jgi:hypothetical protein
MMRRLVILMAVTVAGVGLSACDWSEFRYGPDQTGYNSGETTLSTSNVAQLVQKYSATPDGSYVSSALIANGVVYITSAPPRGYGAELETYDGAGLTNCSGTPHTCAPLWTTGADVSPYSDAIIAGGMVYVASGDAIDVFDAAGNTNCSGSPKVCEPLWSYSVPGGLNHGDPTVANGILYVAGNLYQPGGQGLAAFDATGSTNCSGTPKICQPLWTAPVAAITAPAVANGVVYVSTDAYGITLQAYDASGKTNCSGAPTVCQPLWSGQTASTSLFVGGGQPAVAGGHVYVTASSDFPTPFSTLFAFDASGGPNCSGTPRVCQPLWSAPKSYSEGFADAPAVANGVVYAGSAQGLDAYDASGKTSCSGTPTVCQPLWTGDPGVGFGVPSVANGVVYVAAAQTLYAFDAAGKLDCSGTPTTCGQLWSETISGYVASAPSISNGMVYLTTEQTQSPAGGGATYLYAFGLP